MAIKSNASPDEKKSPFYKNNEIFCSEFEYFIIEKNGKAKGYYNAWSYSIFGKILKHKNWTLKYKKATFSSGNLWLSSKHQNLLVLAEWETKRAGTYNSEFLIRKKTKTDFIKKIFNKSLSKFNIYDKYIIESENNKSQLISQLNKILEPLFKSEEIYIIDHRNNRLKIELRTEKHYFDIFNELTEL
jgi:hypothetical protein